MNAWNMKGEFELPRCFKRPGIVEDSGEPLMQPDLNGLSDARRKLTPPLHRGECRFGNESLPETRSKKVGRGDRILNGQVDADSSGG